MIKTLQGPPPPPPTWLNPVSKREEPWPTCSAQDPVNKHFIQVPVPDDAVARMAAYVPTGDVDYDRSRLEMAGRTDAGLLASIADTRENLGHAIKDKSEDDIAFLQEILRPKLDELTHRGLTEPIPAADLPAAEPAGAGPADWSQTSPLDLLRALENTKDPEALAAVKAEIARRDAAEREAQRAFNAAADLPEG